MLDKKYNIAVILVILVLAFIIISYLRNLNVENKKFQETTNPLVKQNCEETCSTEACLYSCYSTLINVAVAEKSIKRCNEIKYDKIKQDCLDKVNFILKNCDIIMNEELKVLCLK